MITTSQRVVLPDFAKYGGLITVVAQDYRTGKVLMVASTDQAGYLETLRTGEAVYFSRKRQKRWKKGESESGNIQKVHGIAIDCDDDAIIYFVEQTGSGACHTGALTCFFRDVVGGTKIMEVPGLVFEHKSKTTVTDVHIHIHPLAEMP